MNAICTINFLLVALSICYGKPTLRQKCLPDTIDFASKVENSSIVVYGTVDFINPTTENKFVFNVKFEVDCILKGPRLPKFIMIRQVGKVENKTNCQLFPISQTLIVFLERDSSNDSNSFTPADFSDLAVGEDLIDDALTNTCNLQQIVPIESTLSITDACPSVSTNPICTPTTIKSYVDEKIDLSPIVIPGGSQLGIDSIQSKSGTIQVDVDQQSDANLINISSFLIVLTMLFVRWN